MRLLVIILISTALAGCASTKLATCDGQDRRPVNAPPHAGATYPSCGLAA